MDEWQLQRDRVARFSLALRRSYYEKHKCEGCYFEQPHGIAGNITESIGAWPEFIFRGTFCKRTFKGYCSPCFYSQFPINHKEKGARYESMLRRQIDYVLDHFDELVVERQYEHGPDGSINGTAIKFVMTPTGSFFDENEFPQRLRIEMLKKLKTKSDFYGRPIQLHIESHCEDWLDLDFYSKETVLEMSLLKSLNTRVIFGFESTDEYVRNVLYTKNLSKDKLEKAIASVQAQQLRAGVFIFAGLFSMNDLLTIEDVKQSIIYALDHDLIPVLMFLNVQQYTITDLLFQDKMISLLEPFTVMEIILFLISELEKHNSSVEWLIADPKGGPPVPEFNIFDCAQITTREHAETIYQMVHSLRIDRNTHAFREIASQLRATANYQQYVQFLNACSGRDTLVESTNQLLDHVERRIASYGGELT